MKKSLKLSVLLVYLTGALAHAAEPIKIGVSAPFTGPGAGNGIPMRESIKIAAEEINKNGGVLGRQIELVMRDDEAKPEIGATVAQELINKEKVIATVGIAFVGVALSSARFYQEAKVPLMITVPMDKRILAPFYSEPENYVFRSALMDEIQVGMVVQEMVDKRKYSKIAIIADATPLGQGGVMTTTAALAKRGITPVLVEKYNQKDADMTPQLLKAKLAGAETLLAYGTPYDIAVLVNGMTKVGWKVPVFGNVVLQGVGFLKPAKENAEGVIMSLPFVEEPSTPRRKAFLESYYKLTNTDRMGHPSFGAQSYDGFRLLVAAIRQAGSTEGTKIREALENLKDPVEGLVTTYKKPFSKEDHEALGSEHVFMAVVKDGKVAYLNESDKAKGMPAAPAAQSPTKKAKKKN